MAQDTGPVWTVRTHDRALLGVSDRVLRGPQFVRLRRGVYAVVGTDPEAPDARIAAVAATLPPHAVLGGWAAARVHERLSGSDEPEVFDGSGWWDEGRHQHSSLGAIVPTLAVPASLARVLVCAGRHSRLAHRPDVRVFRSPVPEENVRETHGLRITDGVRTAFDLARLLPVGRAVTALDRLAHLNVIDVEGVARFAAEHECMRGAVRVRRLLPLVDGGAESPQESVLRLLWVAARLGRPVTNAVVRTARGEFVARVDLLDPATGVAAEYDGAWHSGSDRRSRDAQRQEQLLDLGIDVVRATGSDLASDARARRWQERLRAAYRRRAGLRTRGSWVVDPAGPPARPGSAR